MTKKSFTHLAIKMFLVVVLFVPLFAHGQISGTQDTTPTSKPAASVDIHIDNPLKQGGDLKSLIVQILNNVVMPIAAVASVIYVVLAGFKYVMAQGNSKKIEEANANLLWALIGIGVLLGAAGISKVIQNTINTLIK
ncbi:MAG: hypothetical protein V4473_01435 [Patescibacteria group bacterium]